MPKDLGTLATASFESNSGKVAAFVQFNFISGTQRYSTLPYNVTWQGVLWQGVGALAEVSEIRESEALVATGMRIAMSGLSSSIVSLALGEHVQGRSCAVWFLPLDDNGAPFTDSVPPVEFEG